MIDDHVMPVRRTRASGFDYRTRGTYFVTCCTQDRAPILARLLGEESVPTRAGMILLEEWQRTPHLRPDVRLDAFVVMPDHFHGLFVLHPAAAGVSSSVSRVVGGLKAATTLRINRERQAPGAAVWQRSYYFRLLRSPESIERAREYIRRNPAEAAHVGGRPAASQG